MKYSQAIGARSMNKSSEPKSREYEEALIYSKVGIIHFILIKIRHRTILRVSGSLWEYFLSHWLLHKPKL